MVKVSFYGNLSQECFLQWFHINSSSRMERSLYGGHFRWNGSKWQFMDEWRDFLLEDVRKWDFFFWILSFYFNLLQLALHFWKSRKFSQQHSLSQDDIARIKIIQFISNSERNGCLLNNLACKLSSSTIDSQGKNQLQASI